MPLARIYLCDFLPDHVPPVSAAAPAAAVRAGRDIGRRRTLRCAADARILLFGWLPQPATADGCPEPMEQIRHTGFPALKCVDCWWQFCAEIRRKSRVCSLVRDDCAGGIRWLKAAQCLRTGRGPSLALGAARKSDKLWDNSIANSCNVLALSMRPEPSRDNGAIPLLLPTPGTQDLKRPRIRGALAAGVDYRGRKGNCCWKTGLTFVGRDRRRGS